MKGKMIANNRRARYDYEILDTYEAGISLLGTEVRAIKTGQISINEAYVKELDGDLWLWNAHVPKYKHSSIEGYDPGRARRLLLKKKEIRSIIDKLKSGKLTLIPLKIYLSHGLIKLEIALARGKKRHEKQRRIKERDLKRELHREKRNYMIK